MQKFKGLDIPFARKSVQSFIKQVKDAPSAAEERMIIAKESANIRDDFSQSKSDCLWDDIVKLIFIHLLGYPAHFGQMSCMQLISYSTYKEKRIGYLAMDLFLTDDNELLLLVVNSIKNDIKHKNPYIVGLALTMTGNLCNEQLARDVFPEVIPYLSNDLPYLRKKACLALIKISHIAPDLVDDLVRSLPPLLIDNDHGVLVSATQLTLSTLELAPQYKEKFRKLVPRLIKRARVVISGTGKAECAVDGVADPFVQVAMIQLLGVLAEENDAATEQVADFLLSITSKADSTSVAGNAVLYECVRTILMLDVSPSYLIEAANILGKFLQHIDANIRYVSLSLFMKMISIDDSVLIRHRSTVLACIKEEDPSIRRRAIDVVIALVRLNNVEEIAMELLQTMVEVGDEDKRILTTKITSLVQQFAPSSMWQVDTLLTVLQVSGAYSNDEVLSTLVGVVSPEDDELAKYTVHRLYQCLREDTAQTALTQTAVWFIGEYGDFLLEDYEDDDSIKRSYIRGKSMKVQFDAVESPEVLEMIGELLVREGLDDDSKGMALTCLMKLSDRFDNAIDTIRAILAKCQNSICLELQQRACEYLSLLELDAETILDPLLERMPVLDIDNARALRLENEEVESEEEEEEESSSSDKEDLLHIQDEVDNTNDIMDIMGILDTNVTNEDEEKEVVTPRRKSEKCVYDEHGVKVGLKIKNGNTDDEYIIKATITNANDSDVDNLKLLTAVPKYMTIQMKPLSCEVVSANNGGSCTQLFKIRNAMIGEKKTVMKLRVQFTLNWESFDDIITVDDFDDDME